MQASSSQCWLASFLWLCYSLYTAADCTAFARRLATILNSRDSIVTSRSSLLILSELRRDIQCCCSRCSYSFFGLTEGPARKCLEHGTGEVPAGRHMHLLLLPLYAPVQLDSGVVPSIANLMLCLRQNLTPCISQWLCCLTGVVMHCYIYSYFTAFLSSLTHRQPVRPCANTVGL